MHCRGLDNASFVLFDSCRTSEGSDEQYLNDDVDGQQDYEGELQHVAKERGHLYATLLGNTLHHEVGAVANVRHGTKEDGSHADGL